MRFIRDIHAEKQASGKPTISFEFFPFKTPEGEATFFGKTLPALMTARPDYASVTYGAGGSTREKTLEIVGLRLRDPFCQFRKPTRADRRGLLIDHVDPARGRDRAPEDAHRKRSPSGPGSPGVSRQVIPRQP